MSAAAETVRRALDHGRARGVLDSDDDLDGIRAEHEAALAALARLEAVREAAAL